jgi:hypothetical protein
MFFCDWDAKLSLLLGAINAVCVSGNFFEYLTVFLATARRRSAEIHSVAASLRRREKNSLRRS